MGTTIVKEIELENGHRMIIEDRSRKISEDAFLVAMRVTIDVEIKNELFDDKAFADENITQIKLDDIKEILGDSVTYEYMVERNFIMAPDKETVFESLVNTFMENLGQYVAKPQFPGKFVLKAYKDKTK